MGGGFHTHTHCTWASSAGPAGHILMQSICSWTPPHTLYSIHGEAHRQTTGNTRARDKSIKPVSCLVKGFLSGITSLFSLILGPSFRPLSKSLSSELFQNFTSPGPLSFPALDKQEVVQSRGEAHFTLCI